MEPGESDATAISLGVMPTLLEFAGASVPEGHTLDGTSLARLLTEGRPLPDRTLFWGYQGAQAMRDGAWKLITGGDRVGEGLYNLAEDVAEKHDLAKGEPDRTRRMREAIEAWRRDVAAGATVQPTA